MKEEVLVLRVKNQTLQKKLTEERGVKEEKRDGETSLSLLTTSRKRPLTPKPPAASLPADSDKEEKRALSLSPVPSPSAGNDAKRQKPNAEAQAGRKRAKVASVGPGKSISTQQTVTSEKLREEEEKAGGGERVQDLLRRTFTSLKLLKKGASHPVFWAFPPHPSYSAFFEDCGSQLLGRHSKQSGKGKES